jgi:hypothetical protein
VNRPGDELSLRTWAAELEAAAKIARDLAPTSFLPATHRRFYRDDHGRMLDGKDGRPYRLDLDATTATAAAAIMRGWELGLPPGAALASIAVINDTPALSALALRAILQTNGHDIWVVPGSDGTRAIVRARREGSADVQESTWTLDRARTAGLFPGAEKSQWRKNPAAMLVARATAEASRWVAADAILGIPYIVEELIDALEEPDAPAPLALEPAPPPAAGDGQAPKRARRKSPAAPPALPAAPPPTADPDPVAEADPAAPRPVPDTPAEMITDPQRRRLHASFRDIGLGGPEHRLDALSLINGWLEDRDQPVERTSELTMPEARIVLENLDKMIAIAARPDEEGPPRDEPQ